MERRSYWLADQDLQAIEEIKERYGITTDSQAVRIALRIVAKGPMAQILPPPMIQATVPVRRKPRQKDAEREIDGDEP